MKKFITARTYEETAAAIKKDCINSIFVKVSRCEYRQKFYDVIADVNGKNYILNYESFVSIKEANSFLQEIINSLNE